VWTTPEPWAFVIPAGELVQEASGVTWFSDYPVVALFWPQRYYQVFVLLKATTTEYYCNIIAPPQYEPNLPNSRKDDLSAVTFFDLDLDLYVKMAEGKPKVDQLDVAEFEHRQSGYSREWILGALAGNDELVRLAQTSSGPFAPATAFWWREYVKRNG